MYMAVINGMVCINVPKGTKGAINMGGEYWLPERKKK